MGRAWRGGFALATCRAARSSRSCCCARDRRRPRRRAARAGKLRPRRPRCCARRAPRRTRSAALLSHRRRCRASALNSGTRHSQGVAAVCLRGPGGRPRCARVRARCSSAAAAPAPRAQRRAPFAPRFMRPATAARPTAPWRRERRTAGGPAVCARVRACVRVRPSLRVGVGVCVLARRVALWRAPCEAVRRRGALALTRKQCTCIRRTGDGWALLSTKRDGAADVPARDEKVGQPKGLSEYGWGETGYALSSASRPLMGKRWVSAPSAHCFRCGRVAAAREGGAANSLRR